eukprot:252893_1
MPYLHSIYTYVLWYLPLIPAIILISIAICSSIRLHKLKDQTFMQKRAVPFSLNCSMIFGMCFATLFYLSIISNNIWSTAIFEISFYASWFLIFSFLNARSWMIYFRYRWTYYTLQLEWQQLINPKIVEQKQEHNWYIHNYKKYGNVSYIYHVFSIVHFIEFLITLTLSVSQCMYKTYMYRRTTCGFVLLLMFIPVISHIIIIHKTPIFHDYYYIHRESKLHSKLSIVLMISYAIANISESIFNKSIYGLIIILTMPYILFLMIYVSTFVLMSKNKKKKYGNKQFDAEPERVRDNYCQITLDDILSNSKYLHLFMVHLSKEFSIECLLLYIEVDQFQKYCLNEINDVQVINTLPRVMTMRNLENVPESQIVQETGSSMKFDMKNLNKQILILADAKMKAHELYNKYIAEGSKFEINISDTMRSKLKNILEDKNNLINKINVKLADLVKLFEESKKK